MKLIVVSNYYPPRFHGGYELGCQQIVDELRARGHCVEVLTSKLQGGEDRNQSHVHRKLEIREDWSSHKNFLLRSFGLEIRNQRAILQAIRKYRPDLVYFWNTAQIGLSGIYATQGAGVPTAFFVSDHWMSGFGKKELLYEVINYQGTWRRRILERFLLKTGFKLFRAYQPIGSPSPDLIQYCSEFLRSKADQLDSRTQTQVVHWGVSPEKQIGRAENWPVKRFLYTGRLTSEKGVKTAIEAFVIASKQGLPRGSVFTLCGAASNSDFQQSLLDLAQGCQNGCQVVFKGKLSREEVLEEYRNNDVFLFPSEWDEPFSIALLEAFSAGLAVVGTDTGGTPEILRDRVNGLVYQKGNTQQMALAIQRIATDRELYQSIRSRAIQDINEQFSFSRMADRIETQLDRIIADTRRGGK
jgi:glycogen(starch) synthase